jgi:DNA-binding protein H-NS
LRRNELKTVIAQIRKTISDYGLTAADLGLGKKGAKPARKPAAKGKRRGSASVGAPKYRDPVTQQTWTGRGRPPAWIVAAKNRDDYLIHAAKAAAPRRKAATRGSKPGAAAKSTRSTAKKKAAPKKKARAAKKTRAKRMIKTPAVRIESGVASE